MQMAWGLAPAAVISAIDSPAACGGHHVVHNQYPPLQRRADQNAAFAVVFGFFAVIGKRHIATPPGQFHHQRRAQRNALVGRAKNHVELNATVQNALGIKTGQAQQSSAVIEQSRR